MFILLTLSTGYKHTVYVSEEVAATWLAEFRAMSNVVSAELIDSNT